MPENAVSNSNTWQRIKKMHLRAIYLGMKSLHSKVNFSGGIPENDCKAVIQVQIGGLEVFREGSGLPFLPLSEN